MLITATFGSSKAAPAALSRTASASKEDAALLQHQPRPSSLEESTSTTVLEEVDDKNGRQNAYSSDISITTPSLTPLTTSQATTLNLFLRSSGSIASLQIADIQGVIDEKTGDLLNPPAVRKGRIRTSSNGNTLNHSGIQCCIIDAMAFEKCEIVATIVKKNAIYRQVRQNNNGYTNTSSDHKGKERQLDNDLAYEEQVQLIFYDVDDDSGASITCCVNPSKVYAKELSEARNRQASSSSSASSCDSHSDNESRTTTFSNHVSLEANADEKTPRASRAPSRRDASSLDDGGQIKRDPRLWMYRYKSPPRPTTSVDNPSKKTPSSFKVPIYKEGTIVRIIGKIFINTTRGNERQIEVSSIQSLYEPGYIIGRRIYKDRGNKYAEWHHNVKCRKKRLEYQDRERVRELIGFESEKTNGTDLSNCISQSICHDVTMQDDSMAPLSDTMNTTIASTSYISSISLLDRTHFTDNSLRSSTDASSSSSSSVTSSKTANKPKRAKLPSCSTLYKQKITITKEIFSLYMHQFFRDVEKRFNGKRDRILPAGAISSTSTSSSLPGFSSGSLDQRARMIMKDDLGAGVTLNEIKEDKNLKWLAEIYARNEAKRLAILDQLQDDSANSDTPKPRKRYLATNDGVESSIILPSSSPAYSLKMTPHQRTTPSLVDTTNMSSIGTSSSSTSSIMKSKKIRVEAGLVDKIRNDLFRNTILKLVKDGIIIVYPADLSMPRSEKLRQQQQLQLKVKDCPICMKKIEAELEKVPPIMTMEGTPLRELKAREMKESDCKCALAATRQQSQASEETYALLTTEMLLPIVENIVARMDRSIEIQVDYVWNAIKRQDEMWRFVSKELVKESLEMV